ncbi:related to WD40-repeat protein (notchless protein) [Serendipita indica DSM 11827]|uniref:Related to WD40-repeat protein (Notchless protein) n=1 Tax=Serendipita indica (strain DSM 11827) TaxID=1109443 RepID=G4TXW6_SERID|nr:related to WD40-repeat protein (notchless protein) [Serendipita indica DSM 11827]
MSKSWFEGKGRNPRSKDTSKQSGSQSNASNPSTSSRSDKVRDTAIPILELVANISEGSDALASLKAACRATKQILEITRAVRNNKEDWKRLSERLQGHLESMESQVIRFGEYPEENRKVDDTLLQPLLVYVRQVIFDNFIATLMIVIKDLQYGPHGSLALLLTRSQDALAVSSLLHIQAVKGDTEALIAGTQGIKEDAKTLLKDADLVIISQLPIVLSTSLMVHNRCNPGTRETVLDSIRRWGHGEFSEPIFWLCDIAGSGKSTVSASMIAFWKDAGILGGHFFFSIATTEESTIAKMCPTFARQIFENIPTLAPSVMDAVKRHPSIITSTFEEQFQKLIVEPTKRQNNSVILVIDALDECKSVSERRRLVETLSMAVRESANLKIFMTSRPDPVIQAALGSLPIKAKMEDRLHDSSHRDNIDDIAIYIEQMINGMLPEDKKRRLVKSANGLFIWASTACRMLKSETTWDTHETIYANLISVDKTGDIDDVYELIFERIEPKYRPTMYGMLAILLAAFEPLSVDDLEDILKHTDIGGDAKALIRNLGSVLTIESSTSLIRFRHPTLVEYLRRRSHTTAADSYNKVHINIAKAHGQVASWCLKRLNSPNEGVKFNICQVESSFHLNGQIRDLEARISKCIPRRLRYASSHWLFHLTGTDDKWRGGLKREVEHILQSPYVLYWMEILSFIGEVPRAIAGLRAVTCNPTVSGLWWRTPASKKRKVGEETRRRMTDIRRFVMAFAVPIQQSAPHIYISALPFSPTKSILHVEGRKRYANSLAVTRGYEEAYSEFPRTLRGDQGSIWAVAFSPDGSRIISGSLDKTIRVWDSDTGQALGEPLRGHEHGVTTVGFSPDGSLIVSGSEDKTIRLWEMDTGRPLGEPLRGHEDCVAVVAFSPDSSQIVSGSWDRTIRLWDVETGQPLGEPFQGHESSVNSVAFSPDGSRIASASDDRTIRLWEVASGHP